MPTTTHETLPRQGAALIPDAHDIALATASRPFLETLAGTKDDLTITVTAEGGVAGQIRMPASAVRLLCAAMSELASGNGVSLLPLTAELTTQEAAEILNVSRPFVVGLLEKGAMAYRKVGAHRRVSLREVLDYKARTDIDRRAALDELAGLGQEMGVGYET